MVESYLYDPYGKPTIKDKNGSTVSTSQVKSSYLFTARQLDEETGFYYYRARHYSPEVRRFVQRDPLEYYDSPCAYAYVLHNPIVATDPMGAATCPTVKVCDSGPTDIELTYCVVVPPPHGSAGDKVTAGMLAKAEEAEREKAKKLCGTKCHCVITSSGASVKSAKLNRLVTFKSTPMFGVRPPGGGKIQCYDVVITAFAKGWCEMTIYLWRQVPGGLLFFWDSWELYESPERTPDAPPQNE